MWQTRHEDFIAFERYTEERDDPRKYAVRLLCLQHGVLAVSAVRDAGQIRGEGGAGKRLDYEFTLACGCLRRKDLRMPVVKIEAIPVRDPDKYTRLEQRTTRRVEDEFEYAAQGVVH